MGLLFRLKNQLKPSITPPKLSMMRFPILLPLMVLMSVITNSFSQVLDTVSLYDISKMSRKVNSGYHEGAPIISSDGNTIYFFRTNHPQNKYGKDDSQDIWFSTKNEKGDWNQAERMDSPLNKHRYNQVLAIEDNGNYLLITGGKDKGSKGISMTYKENGQWTKPHQVHIPGFNAMNVGQYYGATMTQDRSYMIHYFSETPKSQKSDLYLSIKKNDNHYTRPIKLPLSTTADEFSPFISADTKTLYFSSDRKGTLGQADVWKTTRLDDSWMSWSEPVNLGAPVNSKGFDAYFSVEASWKNAYTTRAFMSADGGSLDILHFIVRPEIHLKGRMTDRKTGLPVAGEFRIEISKVGHQDLITNQDGRYKTKIKDRGLMIFSAQVAGYEYYTDTLDLNETLDQEEIIKNIKLDPKPKEVLLYGAVYAKSSKKPLFSNLTIHSQRFGENTTISQEEMGDYSTTLPDVGKYRITVEAEDYYKHTEVIEVPDGESPIRFQKDFYLDAKQYPIFLKGILFNSNTQEQVVGGTQLTSPSGLVIDLKTDDLGRYKTKLDEPGLYKLYTAVPGYMASNDTTTVYIPSSDFDFRKDIFLTPIEVGASVRLNEIYFDSDESTLRPQSRAELDRVKEFMTFNQNIKVEISGHTDDQGSHSYNESLSQRRAQAVVNYLVQNNVNRQRLVAKGYGEVRPVVDNNSEENRQYNRRVEFTILEVQ